MERDAIARAQRRKQAEEALEVERDRMALLQGEIEEQVTELLGAGVDDKAFAAMQPEDVQTVREILGPAPDFEIDEGWTVTDEDEAAEEDPEPEAEEDPSAEIEAEISRLEAEIALSRRRQQALERYIAALGG